jgi:hypothetical protein
MSSCIGNQLVGPAVDHQAHHVALALGQLGQAHVLQAVALAQSCQPTWALGFRACSMRSTSALLENGFSTKSKAPRLTAIHRRGHVAMAGEEDDRQAVGSSPRHQASNRPGRSCRACARPAAGSGRAGPGGGLEQQASKASALANDSLTAGGASAAARPARRARTSSSSTM